MKLEELNESGTPGGTQTDKLEDFLKKKYKIIDSESGRIVIEDKVQGKKVRFEVGIYGKQLSVHPSQRTEDDNIQGRAEDIEFNIEQFLGIGF